MQAPNSHFAFQYQLGKGSIMVTILILSNLLTDCASARKSVPFGKYRHFSRFFYARNSALTKERSRDQPKVVLRGNIKGCASYPRGNNCFEVWNLRCNWRWQCGVKSGYSVQSSNRGFFSPEQEGCEAKQMWFQNAAKICSEVLLHLSAWHVAEAYQEAKH